MGRLYKSSKPWAAMVVARCVESGHNWGGAQGNPDKVSVSAFAERSGMAWRTVDKYLTVWDAIATAGLTTSPAWKEYRDTFLAADDYLMNHGDLSELSDNVDLWVEAMA